MDRKIVIMNIPVKNATSRLASGVPVWTLTDRLRKAREITGLSQAEFGKEIDISASTVSNYEAGRVEPRRIALKQWALRAGVPLEWLITDDETSPDGEECPWPDSNRRPSL